MKGLLRLVRGFIDIVIGMLLTFRTMFRPKVTLRYPYERRPVGERYRGMFYLKWNEQKQRLNCVGCGRCEQACPTHVITMSKVGKGVDEFHMDLGRCMFCNLCVEACPYDAIHMGGQYEFAVEPQDGCVMHIRELAQGGIEHAETNIAAVHAATEAAEKAAVEEAT